MEIDDFKRIHESEELMQQSKVCGQEYFMHTSKLRKYSLRKGYWINNVTSINRWKHAFGDDFPNLNGGTVLDVGCAQGWSSISMKQAYPDAKLFCMDLFFQRVKYSRQARQLASDAALAGGSVVRKDGLSFVVADAYAPPFRRDSFDFVLCLNNFLYVCEPQDYSERFSGSLSNLGMLVKEGGSLIASADSGGVLLRKKDGLFRKKESFYMGRRIPDYQESSFQKSRVENLLKLVGQ